MLCAPGNAGIAEDARSSTASAEDVRRSSRRARTEAADLVVVGPEAPLVERRGRRARGGGIPAFGPTAARRRSWRARRSIAKEMMAEAGVPTAGHAVLRDCRRGARRTSRRPTIPAVLKADGLAAGKGVIICESRSGRPRRHRRLLRPAALRADGGRDQEEFLDGEELSLLALCDGENVVPLAPAQDYKRIFDGDEGPNTGGMGSYSPVPGVDPEPCRGTGRRRPPPRRRAHGQPGHAVPGRPLRRAHDDLGRAKGPRVQHPLRRSRDPGSPAPAALRPGRALPREPRARRPRRHAAPTSPTTGP